jgi:hypothetical protein
MLVLVNSHIYIIIIIIQKGVFSSISDGMCSSKTKLPHHGDKYDFQDRLKMHIQGELCHGRYLHIYRTFSNIKGGKLITSYCKANCVDTIIEQDLIWEFTAGYIV